MQGIIFLIIIGCTIFYFYNRNKKRKELLRKYHEALCGTNKRVALNAGRAYYSAFRRGGKLTMYDEQAINNDLNTMKL